MKILIQLLLCFLLSLSVLGQKKNNTSSPKKKAALTVTDSIKKQQIDTAKTIVAHDPRKATFRSAVLPGWGQIYNKKYWKAPIVWGALGTCVGVFIYNRNEYVDARDAYRYMLDDDVSNDNLIKPKFRPVDPGAVASYRNSVRQYVDYSVIAFLICWGLNVVDATVDGHLLDFNVNDNLSFRLKPNYAPVTKQANIGLVVKLGK